MKKIMIVGAAAFVSLGLSGCEKAERQSEESQVATPDNRTLEMTWVVPVNRNATATEEQVVNAMRTMDRFYATQPGYVRSDILVNKLDDGNASYAHVSVWSNRAAWEAMMGSQAFSAKQDEVHPFVDLNLARAYRRID